jgi:hypothetical protein
VFACSWPARVAQWIERLPPEQEVAGSTPAAGTYPSSGRLYGGPFFEALLTNRLPSLSSHILKRATKSHRLVLGTYSKTFWEMDTW